MSIDELRSRIDALDDELLALIARRAALAIEVAVAKRKKKLPPRDPERESAILARARTLATGPLTPDAAEQAMRALIDSTMGIAQLRAAKPSPSRRVTIIGAGLIGGSLARALKVSNPDHVIRAVDLPTQHAALSASGLFSSVGGPDDIRDAVWDAEVVFLCAPPGVNASLLAPLREAVQEEAIVTDTSGLKVDICKSARKLFSPTRGPWFTGGHPMAGSARQGFSAASELLFAGRPWLLTPHRKSTVAPLKRVQRLVESTGARAALITAEEHDRVIAAVSHVPQILALALSLSVAGRGQGMAGPALIEMTRLADSPAALWAELLRSRNGAVIQEMQRLRTYLTQFEMALTFGEPIEGWFERASARRKDILPP